MEDENSAYFQLERVLENAAVPSLLLETSDQDDTGWEEISWENVHNAMEGESDYYENEHNDMEGESDYSVNEHSVDDRTGYLKVMSSEKENSDSENESCEYREEEMKRRAVDGCGEFKVIACELCNREFSRKLALEHHLKRIHRLSENKIDIYLQKVVHHTAQNYKCDACKRVFYKVGKLASHHCAPAIAVMCEICKQKFVSKTGLKRHLLSVHQLGKTKVDSIMEELADYNSRFYKKFKVAEDIVISSSDGRVICKEGGSQFKTSGGQRCSKCNKAFTDEYELIVHVCEPTIEIECEICKYKAPTKYNMKRHFIRRHKLSESDINSAMEEFNCYNEKLQLRTPDASNKLVKRKSSRRLIRDRIDNSFEGSFEKLLQETKNASDFGVEDGASSSNDEQYILPNTEKTCKRCYKTFKNRLLFAEHDCDLNDGLIDSPAEQFISRKIKKEVNSESNAHVRKLVCEVCNGKFSLRIALRRHLSRSHDLDEDAIDALLERTSGNIDSSDFNSGLDCQVSKEESHDDVNLISHTIEPIDCEVCHGKLYSKKDLKGHLVKCFKMKESTLNSIFSESKDYYAKFYEDYEDNFDIGLCSSDGRVVCKKEGSEFMPVPGPRCKKCHKAFVDEFKIVGHECAPIIDITCKICYKYTAPTKHKIIRHLMNVHKRKRDDIDLLLEEFKGYSERLNLRKKNWPTDRFTKKERELSAPIRETLRFRVENRSSNYFVEEKESSSETEMFQFHEENEPYKKFVKSERSSSASDSEKLHVENTSEVFMKEEKDSQSDSEFVYSFQNDTSMIIERSDSDYEQDNQTYKSKKKPRISHGKYSLKSTVSSDWEQDPTEDHSEMREIVCELCKRKFCRRMSLKKHLNTIHRLGKREVDFYLRRIAYESAANFKCDVCKKQFYKESRLESHDCAPAIAVVCELCQHKLTSKISLKRHLLYSHKLEESKVDSILEELSGFNSKFYKKLKIDGDEIAICCSDGRTVNKKSGSRLIMNSGPRCDACYKTLNKESLLTHECATKIEIGCEICKYNAPSKYNLKRHLILIHKISPSEAKLAMQEFSRYNEKMELREYQGPS